MEKKTLQSSRGMLYQRIGRKNKMGKSSDCNRRHKMTQIPIYRAKKIDSNECVEGFLYNPTPSLFFILINNSGYINIDDELVIPGEESPEIDPNTLSINFDNMIDKNGKKIFASLSEEGIGGDVVQEELLIVGYDEYIVKSRVFFDRECSCCLLNNYWERTKKKNESKTIEQKPKVKYTKFDDVIRLEVIGIHKDTK